MSDNYRLLLAEAARLYEKHGAGRPEPFNVFSVLHKETDEVNLHSRFLHALLDYKKPWTETRENLKDFLQYVAKISDFELYDVEVKRERYNIDILITNADKKAVVIENKTNPNRGDEDKQLWRYYKTLKRQRYLHSNIHLLYLTLDGHDPSPESLGKLKKEKIIKIAYKDNLLQTWLERCQKRAYDEPALRESVAQYLYLITKLTGTNYSEAYMNDLKNLCLKEDNLVLVYDLNKAMEEARISLLNKLWQEIACKLREEIPDLLDLSEEDLDISEERIRRFVTYQTNYRYHGIYYKFSLKFSLHAFLFVEVEDSGRLHYKLIFTMGLCYFCSFYGASVPVLPFSY